MRNFILKHVYFRHYGNQLEGKDDCSHVGSGKRFFFFTEHFENSLYVIFMFYSFQSYVGILRNYYDCFSST